MTIIILLLALSLDYLFGEPKKFHPLVGYGSIILWVEKLLWKQQSSRFRSLVTLIVCVGIPTLLIACISNVLLKNSWVYSWSAAIVVYFCIAPRSLREHASAVKNALMNDGIVIAQQKLAMIVSRDTSQLNEEEISSACCESVLENGSDGIFAAIFWFCIAGLPGIIMYRAANTLDAMWGYKNLRYHQFGWAAARFDDALNFIPAILVAINYALLGSFKQAVRCGWQQGMKWKSINAGMVMASGAGNLHLILGGRASYAGQLDNRPVLGAGATATKLDIDRSLLLIKKTIGCWLVVILILSFYCQFL